MTDMKSMDESREFDAKQRKTAAKKGQAQSDGSYPIKNAGDLKNAIQAYGRSKNKAATKAHIIRRAKALGLTKLLPDGWKPTSDKAEAVAHEHETYDCQADDCSRSFVSLDRMVEHAEAVHTFDDIQRILSEHIREHVADASAGGDRDRTYTWVNDLAEDWVVWTVEGAQKMDLWKASYSITDGKVTLGEPFEVRRRTVYEPVKGD